MGIFFLFFVFALISFVALYRIMKDATLYFFSVLCGILTFVVSVILHYVFPALFVPLVASKFYESYSGFLFIAFIEEGVRFYFFKFLVKRKVSGLALSLIILSFVFSILESTYYWDIGSQFSFLFLRFFGALPLHLGTALLLVFFPRYKLFACVLFHGTYNYLILMKVPWFIPTLVLFVLFTVDMFFWIKMKKIFMKTKYF